MDPQETDSLLDEPQVRRMEMNGREMDGWLRVDVDALHADEALEGWVERGIAYARSLPPK